VPPLRERVEDIPQLARTLLARVARGIGRGPIALADDALESLRRHAWPGNIRELRNVLERAAWLNDTTLLRARDLAYDRVRPAPAADHAHLTLEAMERLHLQRVLDAVGGQVQTAAQRLGIPRSSLYQKLKRFGITTRRG
jgi:DNA-binding NtrC family response regulator